MATAWLDPTGEQRQRRSYPLRRSIGAGGPAEIGQADLRKIRAFQLTYPPLACSRMCVWIGEATLI